MAYRELLEAEYAKHQIQKLCNQEILDKLGKGAYSLFPKLKRMNGVLIYVQYIELCPQRGMIWTIIDFAGRKEVVNLRNFDYSKLENLKIDMEIINYLSKIHEYKGRQDLYVILKKCQKIYSLLTL